MTALGTRSLTATVGGTDYTGQIFNCEIVPRAGESSQTTFAEAAAGGSRIYALKFIMTQDLASTGLWDKIWTSPGSTAAVVIKPYGNATPSASQPHFTGNVIITEPDGTLVGGDADSSATARWQCEISWDFTAKPTRVTA